MVLGLVFGCQGAGDLEAAPPVLLEGPTLARPLDTPLSRRLTLAFDRPVVVTAELATETPSGDERIEHITYLAAADTLELPVHGLAPGATSTLTLRARDTVSGGVLDLDPLSITTDPLPPSFPQIDALATAPDRSEPGYWLVSMGVPGGPFWLAMLDPTDLSVAWLYTGAIDWGDVRVSERGTLIGLWGGVHEVDLLGETLQRWIHPSHSATEIDTPIPWLSLHHEVYPLADGSMLALTTGTTAVEAYPTDYDDPTPVGPATLADDHAVWFDADGGVLGDLAMSDRLDTQRIGFGSLGRIGAGYDWVHTNAVVPDPTGGFLVSSRHQDAIAKFDALGELAWILGDPAGWSAPFAPHLLQPEPGTSWFYHQHGPNFDDNGHLVMFDNRMVTHTPYTPEPIEEPASRVVAYEIDEAAMTVRELWSWEPEETLLSNALGNAVWMPQTGHVLADFGFLEREGDVSNADLGRGQRHARLIEIAPGEAQAVVDARLWIDASVQPNGVKVYRVTHVPSLYGPAAIVE